MIQAVIKLIIFLLWGALWFIPVWLAWVSNKLAWRDWMVEISSRGFLRIAGIRLKVSGELIKDRPLLLVSNHISYFDVLMLASHAPLCFTPKIEISRWPVISTICRMMNCVFVDRRPDKIIEMRSALRDALAKGKVISLFPESTTGNGLNMLPFKSGFFSLAEEEIEGKELIIQPAAMTYTHIRRLPIDSTQWPYIAWYGDMDMVSHLWRFLKLGTVDAELAFLPPVTLKEFEDRKALANHCYNVISKHIEAMKSR
jgi:lyso-ornithine lipid O-acyltransferase